jgi:hypothetical protein
LLQTLLRSVRPSYVRQSARNRPAFLPSEAWPERPGEAPVRVEKGQDWTVGVGPIGVALRACSTDLAGPQGGEAVTPPPTLGLGHFGGRSRTEHGQVRGRRRTAVHDAAALTAEATEGR